MKLRNTYLSVAIVLLCTQLTVTGLLLYVTEHTQAIHYFSAVGNPFSDNPIPLANILTVFEVIDLAIITIYIYRLKQTKQAVDKVLVILLLIAFVLGFAMLLYLHKGPLGSCMSTPDACGG